MGRSRRGGAESVSQRERRPMPRVLGYSRQPEPDRLILWAMASAAVPPQVAELARRLAGIPSVVAVALGGSRATGHARADSDWDLGVYYRAGERPLDPDDVRALGYTGEVTGLGAWGPIVNGGAWLTVDNMPVDVLFRDLDLVEHWLAEADDGRFELLDQHGYLVGAPTYIVAGELALSRPLQGDLPGGVFSGPLAGSASSYWQGRARVSLMFAAGYARGGERVGCVGMLASALLCAAHGGLAGRREWVLNEKRLIDRAQLERAGALLIHSADLPGTVAQVSDAIGIDPLHPR